MRNMNWEMYKGKNTDTSKRVFEDLINIINKNGHELVGEYINASTKITIDFKCGHEPYSMLPCHYKRGHGCIKCGGKSKEQAREDFIALVERNKDKLLSEYIGSAKKVLIDFNCNHEPSWIIAANYRNGSSCPKCSGKNGQAKKDFIEMIKNNGHELLSEYTNSYTKVLIDFKCGHEPVGMTPNTYKSGNRCIKCKASKGEKEITDWLKNNYFKYERQKIFKGCRYKWPLKFDFYIPSINTCIEYDGRQHYQPVNFTGKLTEDEMLEEFEVIKKRDEIKNNYCKANGIKLIRIPYTEHKNIELILDREINNKCLGEQISFI